jgi:hypothetical protein
MSSLVENAEKLASAIQAGRKSTASEADMQTWANQIYDAYQKNPNSPDVKKCREILFPILILIFVMTS